MAKKSAPKPVEPEPETEPFDPVEDVDTDGDDAGDAGGISKAEAARRAIQAGYGQPKKASAYIKEQFGIDMTAQHFSAVKSGMKKKGTNAGRGGSDAPRPGTKPRAVGRPFEGLPGLEGGSSDILSALEAMKPLVASLGADQVKRLADILG